MKTTFLLLFILLLAIFVTVTAFFIKNWNNKKEDNIYLKKIILPSTGGFSPVTGEHIYLGATNDTCGKITMVEKGDQYDLVLIDLGSENVGLGYSSIRIEYSEKLGKQVIRLVPSKKLLKPHRFIALILLHS